MTVFPATVKPGWPAGTSCISALLSKPDLGCGHERVFDIFPVVRLQYPFGLLDYFAGKEGDASSLVPELSVSAGQ